MTKSPSAISPEQLYANWETYGKNETLIEKIQLSKPEFWKKVLTIFKEKKELVPLPIMKGVIRNITYNGTLNKWNITQTTLTTALEFFNLNASLYDKKKRIEAFDTLLSRYKDGKKYEALIGLFNSISSRGLIPTEKTFGIAVYAYLQLDELEEVEKLVSRKREIARDADDKETGKKLCDLKNQLYYNMYMNHFLRKGKYEKVREWNELSKTQNLGKNIMNETTVTYSYFREGNVEGAIKHRESIRKDYDESENIEIDQYFPTQLLAYYEKNKNHTKAVKSYKEMEEKGIKLSEIAKGIYIHCLFHADQKKPYETYQQLLQEDLDKTIEITDTHVVLNIHDYPHAVGWWMIKSQLDKEGSKNKKFEIITGKGKNSKLHRELFEKRTFILERFKENYPKYLPHLYLFKDSRTGRARRNQGMLMVHPPGDNIPCVKGFNCAEYIIELLAESGRVTEAYTLLKNESRLAYLKNAVKPFRNPCEHHTIKCSNALTWLLLQVELQKTQHKTQKIIIGKNTYKRDYLVRYIREKYPEYHLHFEMNLRGEPNPGALVLHPPGHKECQVAWAICTDKKFIPTVQKR